MEGFDRSWVLYKHGTIVVIEEAEDDVAETATRLLKEEGPVLAGTPLGDFGVHPVSQSPGWAVTSHHRQLLTYVAPEEKAEMEAVGLTRTSRWRRKRTSKGVEPSELAIGLFGREKRERDASDPQVIHVEDEHGQRQEDTPADG
jgi:hypothetical protein